ncbi:MAG: thioesterase [Gammaproteobacteria bacterium]|nr:thioesterase [Gammaproteobacteria bacterium]MDP2139597.1 thioesterase [Gammaproteobacteria bacterium]MDP2346570.1 thioesterase [Gammaproteobacteria bacterium]
MSIEIGTIGRAELKVLDQHLASALNQEEGDGFPEVFATASMIALMELASSRALHPLLTEGEISVGVTVDVTHFAPTARGVTVTAEGFFKGMEGRYYVFDVVARDPSGEIGRGLHKRVIVSRERLLASAAKRSVQA